MRSIALRLGACIAILVSLLPHMLAAQTAPLASWNDTPAKQAILDFVARVTDETSPDFVPPHERIATFDNDGTLWCEQPIYVQAAFIIDRLRAMAPKHPQWQTQQPFQSILEGRPDIASMGEKGLIDVVSVTHSGMTTEEFEQVVAQWLATSRHPRFDRPYTELVYQPMLELLAYLRDHQFKTFIVSGGDLGFMRPFTETSYGIPPQQVVGSSVKTRFEMRDQGPVIVRLPEVDFVDDQGGKPVGIDRFIGRRPICAFGNSDGDLEMLQWATAGTGARLGMIVHHDDPQREYAYDRNSQIGHLDRALTEAPKAGWTIISMQNDWKTIFPTKPAGGTP